MISENTKIIMRLKDTLSYEEYCAATSTPVGRGIFYQTAGMVLAARKIDPDNPERGYEGIITEMNASFAKDVVTYAPTQVQVQTVSVIPNTKPCGTCGGGKVL